MDQQEIAYCYYLLSVITLILSQCDYIKQLFQFLLTSLIQCKPLNVITLQQVQSDNIIQMLSVLLHDSNNWLFSYIKYCTNHYLGLCQYGHISLLITLSVSTLSGFHCRRTIKQKLESILFFQFTPIILDSFTSSITFHSMGWPARLWQGHQWPGDTKVGLSFWRTII